MVTSLGGCRLKAVPGDDSQQVVQPIGDLIGPSGVNHSARQEETDVAVARNATCHSGRVVVTWAQEAHHWTASTKLKLPGQQQVFQANSTVVSKMPVPTGLVQTTPDTKWITGVGGVPVEVCDYDSVGNSHLVPKYDQKLSGDVSIVRTNHGTLIQMGPGERRKPRALAHHDSVSYYYWDKPCTVPAFDVESLLFRVSTDCGLTWTMHSHLDMDELSFDDWDGGVVTMDRPEVYYQDSEDSLWVVGDAEDDYGEPEHGHNVHKSSKILARYNRPAAQAGGHWVQVADLGSMASPPVMTSNATGRLYVVACDDGGVVVTWVDQGESEVHSAPLPLPEGVACTTLSAFGEDQDPIVVGLEFDHDGPKVVQGLRNQMPNISVAYAGTDQHGHDLLRVVFPQIETLDIGSERYKDRQIGHVIAFSVDPAARAAPLNTLHDRKLEAAYRYGSVTFMNFLQPDAAGGVDALDSSRNRTLLTWLETGKLDHIDPTIWRARILQKAIAFEDIDKTASEIVTLTRSGGHPSYWTPMFRGCYQKKDAHGQPILIFDRDEVPKSECGMGDYHYGAFDRRINSTLEFLRIWPQHVPDPATYDRMTTVFGNRIHVSLGVQ